jgi:ubiquinone/menaquinone biosynthesis C-methylase UbiE
MRENVDDAVVDGFGDEWSRFDQSRLSDDEARSLFDEYFSIFPWGALPPDAVGFDFGCGSGRWARLVAPRVGRLHCIDASSAALNVAKRMLGAMPNCEFHLASAEVIPLPDRSADFGYSLGVLHHVPRTSAALQECVQKLRRGAPFLVYLYYRFDNRPWWYSALWWLTDAPRAVISRLPSSLRYAVSQLIAAAVYWPLARTSALLERFHLPVTLFPLSYYRKRPFYVMRTDALDRFGTRLEQRFTRAEIESMMRQAGLERIVFSPNAPYWCAVGIRS